ncbi:LysR family transcriptional regulator [Ramlibacter tataouinensis]|uniref:LysR family transcriptional regulator n=1 Tax=Ramlibacter tataouinensis TaxID=94132 RepID=UPI0022F3FCA4|nr:LysR family transcriptional regulator [Ramlibacter tataouinensis]WBY03017.1 LysR family transcriptional regulator [Ramlibacter tataouinensis]
MDIKELRSFCMVAKLGTFSKASAALNLGQPAVTKHVQRLESELGRSLFERNMRPLRLTAAGSNLLRMAEPLVEGLDTLSQHSPLAATTPVAVGVPHGFIGSILPEAVLGLRSAFPMARARILTGTKEELYEMVQAGLLDFAVAPDPGPSRSLDFTPLFPSERVLIAPRDHPLAKQAPASLEEIARYPLILPRHQTQTRALLESEFRRLRIPYDIVVELDSIELLERYVELGVGLAIGLRGARRAESWIRLSVVGLDHLLPSDMTGLIRRRSSPLSEPAMALIAKLQDLTKPVAAARRARSRA